MRETNPREAGDGIDFCETLLILTKLIDRCRRISNIIVTMGSADDKSLPKKQDGPVTSPPKAPIHSKRVRSAEFCV